MDGGLGAQRDPGTPPASHEGLRYAALFWQMRALSMEAELEADGAPGRVRSGIERWQAWCDAVAGLLTELYLGAEARALLERRYLDGHAVLFPDAVHDLDHLHESAELLAGLPYPVGDKRRGRARREAKGSPRLDLDALRTSARVQAATRTAQLVDLARAATLDVLGETDRAAAIAERQLRAVG